MNLENESVRRKKYFESSISIFVSTRIRRLFVVDLPRVLPCLIFQNYNGKFSRRKTELEN